MCGIAGILTTNPDLDMLPALTGMQAALRHRGPDDEGHEQVSLPGGYRLGLAHTRLAILDLTSAGHQPMHDPESGSWITYNGEIYNHQSIRASLRGEPEGSHCRFRSTCDTETILKAWVAHGVRALTSLRGMFAFGLYDGRRQQFWLVRDRLGVKPLYVSRLAAETWIFASELRALLASGLCNRRLNQAALESYLAFGAVTAPWTLLDGVESLLPGESYCFNMGNTNGKPSPQRTRYWQPPFVTAGAAAPSRAEALERLRPVLQEAVRLRMVSDVPVGVFLSGGIDSSSIVALLTAQGYRVHTFSVVSDEIHYDESEHSRLVARRFGTEHVELFLRPAKVLEEYEQALGAYDQPSVDGLNTYFISQAARQAGVKVALSGLGGDELFAGYPYFRWLAFLDRRLPRRLAHPAHAALRWLAPQATRTRKLGLLLAAQSPLDRYAVCRQVMPPERRGLLGLHWANGSTGPMPAPLFSELHAAAARLDPVNAQSLFELSLYMANMLLRDMDQMSMAHGVEVRGPLVDHVLVETVAGLPGALKLAPGRHSKFKGLLVDALPGELPRSIVRRRKMGFVLPWEHWLRHELKDRVTALLTDRSALETVGLDPQGVQTLWSEYLASRPGIRYTDILCLVHLLHWVQRHCAAVVIPSPAQSLSG